MDDVRFYGKSRYTIEDVGLVKVERDKNYVFHYRDGKETHSLMFVESGAIRYDFAADYPPITANEGTLVFIPKALPYCSTYLENHTVVTILIFDMEKNRSLPFWKKPFCNSNDRFAHIFKTIDRQNSNNTLFLSSKIFETLSVLDSEYFSVPQKYRVLAPAIEEIKQHYYENRKIAYYADLCMMSESNFRKLFRECFGISTVEYRNKIRLSVARNLIDSKEYSKQEAAYYVGFNNMSFFYRSLKRNDM